MSKFIKAAYNLSETLVAIFEDDGETGYLYLYDPYAEDGEKIKAALRAYVSKEVHVEENDIEIVWSNDEMRVGVKIEGKVWGVLDLKHGNKYECEFKHGAKPNIPREMLEGL